jgi:hypothetical protein
MGMASGIRLINAATSGISGPQLESLVKPNLGYGSFAQAMQSRTQANVALGSSFAMTAIGNSSTASALALSPSSAMLAPLQVTPASAAVQPNRGPMVLPLFRNARQIQTGFSAISTANAAGGTAYAYSCFGEANRYYAGSSAGVWFYSTDGKTWTENAVNTAGPLDVWSMSNGRMAMYAIDAGSSLAHFGYSSGTGTFSQANQWPTMGNQQVNCIESNAAGTQTIVLSANTTTQCWSTGGANFTTLTTRSLTTSAIWTSVKWGGDKFVVCNKSSPNNFCTSTDGITWTARTGFPTSYGNPQLAYSTTLGLFLATEGFGQSNANVATTCHTSPDGITWTSRSLTTDFATGVTCGNISVLPDGSFLICDKSSNRRHAWSADGITWFRPANTSTQNINCLIYNTARQEMLGLTTSFINGSNVYFY